MDKDLLKETSDDFISKKGKRSVKKEKRLRKENKEEKSEKMEVAFEMKDKPIPELKVDENLGPKSIPTPVEAEDLASPETQVSNARGQDLNEEKLFQEEIDRGRTEASKSDKPTGGPSAMQMYDFSWNLDWMIKFELDPFDYNKYEAIGSIPDNTTYTIRIGTAKGFKNRQEYFAWWINESVDLFINRMKYRCAIDEEIITFGDNLTRVIKPKYSLDQVRAKQSECILGQIGVERGRDSAIVLANNRLRNTATMNLAGGGVLITRRGRLRDACVVSPLPGYFLRCVRSPLGGYQAVEAVNLNKGTYHILFNDQNLKSSKKLMLLPVDSIISLNDELTYIASRVQNFPKLIFSILGSIIEKYVVIEAGQATSNTQLISQTFGTNLLVTSSLNNLSSLTFSTNALDIFKTLCLASVMSGHFTFQHKPVTTGWSTATFNTIMCYLIYTPAYLLDQQSVDLCKVWIYEKLIYNLIYPGLINTIGINRAKRIQRFLAGDIQTGGNVSIVIIAGAIVNSKIGTLFPTYSAFKIALQGSAPSIVKEFFDYNFVDQTNGIFPRFQGKGTATINLCITFLNGIVDLLTARGTISNVDTKAISATRTNFENQSLNFEQYARYMQICFNELSTFGYHTFTAATTVVQLYLDPTRLMSLLTNLDFFNAKFAIDYMTIRLWSYALKYDIMIGNRFIMYFFDTNKPYNTILNMNSKERKDFLRPAQIKIKAIMSTEVGKMIFDERFERSKAEIFNQPWVANNDILAITPTLNNAWNTVQLQHDYHYTDTIVIRGVIENTAYPGMSYLTYATPRAQINGVFNFPTMALAVYARNARPTGTIEIVATWNKFRIVYEEHNSDDPVVENLSALQEQLRTNQGTIDIKVYYRWRKTEATYRDMMWERPPYLMVYSANLGTKFREFNAFSADDTRTRVDFAYHTKDDFVVTKSSDLPAFFTVKRTDGSF